MIRHSFQRIWVTFSADASLNSLHAHICRQLHESSLASNWACCRPVSLICPRKWVWPLNCCESPDPLPSLVFTPWSSPPGADLLHSSLFSWFNWFLVQFFLCTTPHQIYPPLSMKVLYLGDYFTFLYLWGKVYLSMVVWTAPRLTLPSRSSSCRSS